MLKTKSKKSRTETRLEDLRAQAAAERMSAEAEARRLLVEAYARAGELEQRADDAEFAERVRDRRTELAGAASVAAQAAIGCRAEADQQVTVAYQLDVRRWELADELAAGEAEQLRRRVEVEELTAAGELERALHLERAPSEVDLDLLRETIASVMASVSAARDAAAELHARAEQEAAAAAEHRRASELVEDELRPEYEERREHRERIRALRLVAFDHRELAAATVFADALRQEAEAPHVDQQITLETDAEGRPTALSVPIT